jgi:predicted DNA binding protein
MATVVEFTAPGDSFPLGSVFKQFPELTVELERIVPTREGIIPYFWVRGADEAGEEKIEAAFRDHPDLKSLELVDEVDDQYLLRVEWKQDFQGLLKAIANTKVSLISGQGSGDKWAFEVRSDDRDGVAEFQRYCRDHDLSIELTALHALSALKSGAEYDLTETQREALVLAYEKGYFNSPRESTLDDIAEELGITRQSLASRLRRGFNRLIKSTLIGP